MKKYKGFYIDHVIFNSEADIDNNIMMARLSRLKNLTEMFASDRYDTPSKMWIAQEMDETAVLLVKENGYTWEEIEQLEAEAA